MPEAVKNQLKEFADSRRWTMSQALVYFAEKGLADEPIDREETQSPQASKNSRTR